MPSQGEVLTAHNSTVRKRCAESIGEFSAKLYAHLSKSTDNIFFSPFSIAACLQMVHHGAKGNTKQQTSDVMGILGIEDADILSFYHDTIKSLNAQEDNSTTLSVANRVWVKDNFSVLDSYKAMLQEQLHADILRNSFADPVQTAGEVNAWVAKSTKDMIKELISPDMINGLTRLILCNAIYFKGLWQFPFDTSDEEDFHLTAKDKCKVQMMRYHGNKKLMYGENDVGRWVVIPYKGRKNVSMMVILPQVPYGLKSVEEKIGKPGVINEWFKSASSREVNLKLPKFKFEEKYDLKEVLSQLGVTDLFDENLADLSGVNGYRGLVITDALHKAVIEITEEGTEAAAATAMVANFCMVPLEEEEEVEFTVDQPFVFVVGEEEETTEWEFLSTFLGRFTGK